VRVEGLDQPMEGSARPGHFDGVATVVTKLLLMALPDVALFGEKDWQQLAIIRRLAADLDIPCEIIGGATVREADGLALSSRNAYLSATERSAAPALFRALESAARALVGGQPVAETLATARAAVEAAGFRPDYLLLADEQSLQPLDRLRPGARLFAAARLGSTRLIDNLAVVDR
jgi:pantoate--beta-alanine ligase